MKPVLFELHLPVVGLVTFPSYLTMVALGFVAAVLVARREARRRGVDENAVFDLAVLCLGAGLVGARLLSVLTDGFLEDFVHLCTQPELVDAPDTAVRFCQSDAECGAGYLCNPDARDAVVAGARKTMCHPPRDCFAALAFWQGGLTFYGGLLAAAPLGLWFARRKGLGVLRTGDLAAPALFLGLAIGRVGCFLNGCCYGAPTDGALGAAFPGLAQPRHPTQLYESAIALALFALLTWLARRPRGDGAILGWGLLIYASLRPILELWRDDPRGGLGPLSTSQLLSLPLLAAGAWLVWRARRSAAPSRPPA